MRPESKKVEDGMVRPEARAQKMLIKDGEARVQKKNEKWTVRPEPKKG